MVSKVGAQPQRDPLNVLLQFGIWGFPQGPANYLLIEMSPLLSDMTFIKSEGRAPTRVWDYFVRGSPLGRIKIPNWNVICP